MNEVEFSESVKLLVLEGQGFRCGCGRCLGRFAPTMREYYKRLGDWPHKELPVQAKFHHVNRRANSGSNKVGNCHALCGRCHAREHNYYRKYKK